MLLVPVVGRHDSLMQSFGPQTEGFQLGIDELRKRRAIAFNGQERKLLDIGQNGFELMIRRICCQLFFARHGLIQNGFRQPVGHATKRADGNDTAGLRNDFGQ
mgnify:CR=1 FL=1